MVPLPTASGLPCGEGYMNANKPCADNGEVCCMPCPPVNAPPCPNGKLVPASYNENGCPTTYVCEVKTYCESSGGTCVTLTQTGLQCPQGSKAVSHICGPGTGCCFPCPPIYIEPCPDGTQVPTYGEDGCLAKVDCVIPPGG